MEKLLFALAWFGFISSALLLSNGFTLESWVLAFVYICLLFFWATQIAHKTYSWMCAYETENGSGRIFITSANNQLNRSFVLAAEKYIQEKNGNTHCHIVSLQLMSE